MITKDEIQELLHSTETYRVERTTSTGDMDKFQEAICAFANDNGGNVGGNVGGNIGGKDGGDVVENIAENVVENIVDVPSFVPSFVPSYAPVCHKFCHKLCHKLIKGGKHEHKRRNFHPKGCDLV